MSCSGTPYPCSYHYYTLCRTCGCFWDDVFEECITTPDACTEHDNEQDCEDCGCEWIVPINMKVNIGDVWKDVTEIKINVGDTWKNVTDVWINIGDVWKKVY